MEHAWLLKTDMYMLVFLREYIQSGTIRSLGLSVDLLACQLTGCDEECGQTPHQSFDIGLGSEASAGIAKKVCA